MRGGHPFKVRWGGRPTQGILICPEMLKYKIPTPIAFVPINPEKSPRNLLSNSHNQHLHGSHKQPHFISSGSVKSSPNCQQYVKNFNSCISNNLKLNSEKVCQFYKDYISKSCMMK